MNSMAGAGIGSHEEIKKYEKSYFDVLGICCSSEVPLIEKLLKPLEGVHDVSVIVPSRTVIVLHDTLIISQLQIVKALNQARLEANVRVKGESNYQKKWPSPFAVACGILLLLSFLKYLYHPFQWLALAAVVVGIAPIILKAVASIRNFRVDINILMLIAVAGSIVLKDYWEAGTIVFLFTIAEWLESRASHKATAVMSSLMNIAPQRAVLASTGVEVDAGEVVLNTILAVKAGDIIPIDGIVVDGKCEVDEKTLTGESFPVTKQLESSVWAGTINLNGYISIKTTALAEDCVVAKMAKLVEEAQNNKSKTQRFIDKCAIYYTPAVVIISGCLAMIPAALKLHNRNEWYHLALVVLVSACPCALILSTPIATFCALSKAATSGLLIKGAEYLETLAKIRVMGFDKTGTITRGEFVVSDFHSLIENISMGELLYWVSSIESKSSHPMAAALIDYAHTHSVEPKPDKVEEFQNFPGEGISGRIDGNDIFVGNKKIAIRAGCAAVPNLEGNTNEGKSTGYIFLGSSAAGIFNLSDVCRTGVAEALKELKSMGIKTAMLTGDCQAAANHAQRQLGDSLDIVHAELLPQDKARIIKEFQNDFPTAMVGDGLNDAPALATADIGISMGVSGSALATETGNIILLSNDIRKIPKAVKLARKTRRKIIENVVLSIATKAGIIGLAIAGHPLVWAAVLADVGTCLLVIFNSMLLLRGTPTHGRRKHCSSSHSDKHGCKSSRGHSHSNGHKHCSSVSKVKCSSTMCAPSSCESNKKCSDSKSICKTDHFVSSELHGNNKNGCCESSPGVSKCSGSKITHSCCESRPTISASRGDKKCSDDSEKTRGCCKSTPPVPTSCGRKCWDSEIKHAVCESSSAFGGKKCLDSHNMITIDIEKQAVSSPFEQKSCSENKQDCCAHTHDHAKEANHSTHAETNHFISSELHGNNKNGCCESSPGVSKCSGSKITHSCYESCPTISASRGDKKCSDDSEKTRGCCKSTPPIPTSCGRKCLDSEIKHADCESSSAFGGKKCLDSHDMITIDIEKQAVSSPFEQKSCSENKQDCCAHTHDHAKEANHSTHGSNCDMITLEFEEEHVLSPHGCAVRSKQTCSPENNHSDQETPHCHSAHEPNHCDHGHSDQETPHRHEAKHCDHDHSDQEIPHRHEAKHCDHDHSDQETPHGHEAKHCDHDHSDQETPHCHEAKHCDHDHSDQGTPHCHEANHHDHSHSNQEAPHCHSLHEAKHCDQENPHCNDHKHSGHNSLTSLEPCQAVTSNYKHCHHAPITEEELKNMVRICCKYYSSSHGCANHGTQANASGCCKSFRKECCSKRSAHFSLGGLSEIVIE